MCARAGLRELQRTIARRIIGRAAPLLGAAALSFGISGANASEINLGAPATGTFTFHVTSYAEIPFRTVIHQQYDYSCGSAALATLLRFHYGQDTDEAQIFKAMYAVGDQAKIQKYGFSLLDMKKLLNSRGYKADGYRIALSQLAQMKIPAIALIQLKSYKHFVVIKGVVGDHILIGDPALGLRLYSEQDFAKIWNGIVFLIHDGPSDEHATFNSAVEWSQWSDAHPLARQCSVSP
jgi:predicted double-glycine peptidase